MQRCGQLLAERLKVRGRGKVAGSTFVLTTPKLSKEPKEVDLLPSQGVVPLKGAEKCPVPVFKMGRFPHKIPFNE